MGFQADRLVGPQVNALRAKYDAFTSDIAKRIPLEQSQLQSYNFV